MSLFRRSPPSRPTMPIVGDAWAVYTLRYGAHQRGLISFDLAAAREPAHAGFPHGRRLILRKVIDALLRAGADRGRPHVLEHVFVGPAAGLATIERQLGADGFVPRERAGDRLVMARACPLDLDEVSGLTGALVDFSGSLGVSYDGWGAAVERN